MNPMPEQSAQGWIPLQWIAGEEKPRKPTQAVCKFAVDGMEEPMTTLAWWNMSDWTFCGGAKINAGCLAWWPVPED